MRYIGNKESILDCIYNILIKNNVNGNSFFDFFSGTASASKFFKQKGYQVFSSDFLFFSYCLQKAYIENNTEPKFENLIDTIKVHTDSLIPLSNFEKVLSFLNQVSPIEGFIYNNYTPLGTKTLSVQRTYFIDENGKKIDAIRTQIEQWKKDNLLSEYEYYVLLACLVESIGFYSNITGVYAAFQKKWDKRALRKFDLRPINLTYNDKDNHSFFCNSMDLIHDIDVDILYLDPPYNARQYAPNYHLLETIAKYDSPLIHGVTGMRNYENQKSNFCNEQKGLADLDLIAKSAKFKYLVLSYNSEGIMPSSKIIDTLSNYGKVTLEQFEYVRFKSNNKGLSKTKKNIFEQLYILEKKL